MHIITVCAVSIPRHKSHDERPRARLEVFVRLACFCATSVEISELFSILSYRICKEHVCQPGLLRNCIQAPRKWLSRMLLVFSTRHLLSELTPEASLPSFLLFATFCTPSSPSWLELRVSFRITILFSHYSHFLRQTKPYGMGNPITRNMTPTVLPRIPLSSPPSNRILKIRISRQCLPSQ
ncbi:uncharacterized protein K444DRAFT_382552 [Hyaloscypha bicolor E]|uniref:Uncharacterized protein n=1 Tax=Hyaloscypha bicolor E TaxID=1095630 RepID=A0A2J6TCZ0_9HELO|nr:uncharacterized protein K444DRAFT_382552 [Hyaloscypha bicolor E]PMD60880.1 hypothetical protein K444DRAFT_382552 [Hyaloscypha bicolor E]